jgi:16S rRNA (uracil1498-N3)-methyltransferase
MGHLFGAVAMIPTFIYRDEDVAGDSIALTGSEVHHMIKVMRLVKGEMVHLIDGRGTGHICEIASIDGRKAECRIIKTIKNGGEPGLFLTLAIGLSTASKFDTVLEKGTEAGISRFIPLLTEKGKVKVGEKSAVSAKMKRWRRVVEAAVKQSGRSRIPEIMEPLSFGEFIGGCDKAETALFHPGDRSDNIPDLIDLKSKSTFTIIVGPESGLSSSELETAGERGIIKISLGPRILRTETAGIIIPAILIYMAEMVKA